MESIRTSRRAVLRLGLGAGALIGIRPRLLSALQEKPRKVRGVIWLWMDGGMSQVHTWDPKPRLETENPIKGIDTAVPGIQVSELLPLCAARMKDLVIIRSVLHHLGDSGVATHLMHTGEIPKPHEVLPVIGTLLAHEIGMDEFPLPKYFSIGMPPFAPSTAFNEELLPFELNPRSPWILNTNRAVDRDRDRQRVTLLLQQNEEWTASRLQREATRVGRALVQTEKLMNTPLLKAFNIHEEPADLRASYGGEFGARCLLARRLTQAGCPFVAVSLKGWAPRGGAWVDYRTMARTLDQGLGTLVKDLAEKDLLHQTLVVCATEFGRLPGKPFGQPCPCKPRGFSVVLAGGYLSGGLVYGDTGPDGTRCEAPVSVEDLHATIFSACGLDWEKCFTVDTRQIKYARNGRPVEPLF